MTDFSYPELPDPYATAMREAAAYLQAEAPPLLGVIFAGSVVAGNADPRSDIDTFVVVDADYRQRLHRLFNGVPFEIFINPPHQIPRYFADEQRDGGGSTLHMLARGYIAYQQGDILEGFRQQAQDILAGAPAYDAQQLTMERYMIMDRLENALDLRHRDPAMAYLLLMNVVPQLLTFDFKRRGVWVPRHKDMLATLHRQQPELAPYFAAFYRQAGDAAFTTALYLADIILGTQSFIESESGKDYISSERDD